MSLRILLLLLFSFSSHAQNNYMMMIGGGGEPKDIETTIFDNDLKETTRFIKQTPSWNTEISFNGGHSKTEEILKTLPQPSTPFTMASFNALVKSYEDKIKFGQIKAGDQLMIHINTHGAQGGQPYKTHLVSTAEGALENYDTLGGHTVSLDNLQNLAKLAEQKGIKLAVIDLSCHSGSIIPLANSKTCVITGTGPNHYGYGGGGTTFSGVFNSKLKKGKSLEDVFLDARSDYKDTSFPMISSPQGISVQNKLYDPLTPYLYNFDPKHDKLTPYLLTEVADAANLCRPFSQLESIEKLIAPLMDVAEISQSEIENFREQVQSYYEYLEKIRSDMREVGFDRAKERIEFCGEVKANPSQGIPKARECMWYSVENLMSLNFDNIIATFTKNANENTGKERAEYLARVKFLEKAIIKRDELKAQYPKMSQMQDFWKSYPDHQRTTYEMAYKISRAQQKVYEAMYKTSTAQGPNPCKDFVL
ncbi:MAG: hypothetical protein K2P81_15110 [Bacteriovoracaceae bacterium]|nr:hypothetical protein [Bacteriovoracaceae bacterium]